MKIVRSKLLPNSQNKQTSSFVKIYPAKSFLFKKMGLTSWNNKQPLQDIELQEKGGKDENHIAKLFKKNPKT